MSDLSLSTVRLRALLRGALEIINLTCSARAHLLAARNIWRYGAIERGIEDSRDIFYMRWRDGFWIYPINVGRSYIDLGIFTVIKEELTQPLKQICYSKLKSCNGKNCIRNALITKSVRFKSRETLHLLVQRQFKRMVVFLGCESREKQDRIPCRATALHGNYSQLLWFPCN